MKCIQLPSPRRYLCCAYSLLCLAALSVIGCNNGRSPQPAQKSGGIRFAKNGSIRESGAPGTPTKPATPVLTNSLEDRYTRDIRPLFLHHGCVGGSCHSAFRGGGFFFTGNDERELPNVRARIDTKEPEKSELLLKATGAVQHNGGQNIAPGSCDYRRILAWIANQPDIQCSDEPPRDIARFAREVVPALHTLGCDTCHSQPGAAQVHLDLAGVAQAHSAAANAPLPPAAEALFRTLDSMTVSSYTPWSNSVLAAMLALDGKHEKQLERRSCAFRRVYGYMVGAPELTCNVDETTAPATMPDYDTYVKSVFPMLNKRACFDSNCHGSGVKDMTLRGTGHEQLDGWHDYLMLTARIEDFSQPEKSTLLLTARNKLPHGGGQRLGGQGDCIDDAMTSWMNRKPIQPCKPPPPPSYERFVKEVQPTLDKMTCTQARCHGESIKGYVIKPFAKDEKTLRENYTWTLQKINVDFMPLSEIMLRMREPCAYSKVGAWIENKPSVTCQIVTPPPSAFPKLGDAQHEKAKPGAPPPATKG